MSFNKWTLALAAVGVVSLASAARADEKASTNAVLTALSSTTISGYVDTSMEWNPGTGNAFVPPYKFNSPSKADGFNLDVVQLRIERPLDEGDWAAGYRVDLWFGPDAAALNTSSTFNNSDFNIRQAYVALRAPIGNGLDFKVGVFDSIIGYESVEAGKDPNFTRSYGHTIEPQTMTGLLMSYRFCDWFSASAGVANTTGPQINSRAFVTQNGVYGPDAESYKAYMGSVALTAPDSWGFLAGSSLYGGIVNGYNPNLSAQNFVNPAGFGANQTSYYVGSTIATPWNALRLGAAFDYLEIEQSPGQTWALGGYVSLQASEKLSFHARAEYLKDSSHVLFSTPSEQALYPFMGITDQVLDLTLTAQYDLFKNVITRVEFRWDHSLNDAAAFGGTSTTPIFGGPTAVNAYMLALNVIYQF